LSSNEARKWLLGGRVQGVGFRPFVFRAAYHYRVAGWVRNLAGQVEIFGQGRSDRLARFARALISEAPPLARPNMLLESPAQPQSIQNFSILSSVADAPVHAHVPPDYFACDECLEELHSAGNRRYRYPFINCTQCGPRYTLIRSMPYDRANTTMAEFTLCGRCTAEYANPLDRRYHAEPIACPECGPRVEFQNAGTTRVGEAAMAATINALAAGQIVAVKGVGGYHLMCNAALPAAVAALRSRKRRPHKPLAVMFPMDTGLVTLKRHTELTLAQEKLLLDPLRPIVLVPWRSNSTLAIEIAPGCNEIGAMLPYSPLHNLLLQDCGGPLVVTSANLSGEPVLTDNKEATLRLVPVADAFLHHNRPITRPADDPVYRIIANRPRPLRLGRGCAPLEIELPFALPHPVLALGGHLKNTVAIGWGRRAVVSPHLGNMDAPRSITLLEQVAADLQSLYGIAVTAVVCDAHPGYATTRLARRWHLPVTKIFHHHAHGSALAGEFPHEGDWLTFAWDGAGFGMDGTLWGGEALLGRPGHWRRVATWRPFTLLGGERAMREPWRSALALCWEVGQSGDAPAGQDLKLLRHAWERGNNCPRTSSVGRLFDAASALLGLVSHASHEGHAPMRLESACAAEYGDLQPLPLHYRDGLWSSDWMPLLEMLQDSSESIAIRAAKFHASLAQALMDQAHAVRATHGVSRLGLTGGVFQNRVLCERVFELAQRDGFTVFSPERIPCNDGGLSYGQLVEFAAQQSLSPVA